jgi:hypothetical protein
VVEWVGIFVPRITQLTAIRTIRFGCRETAGRKSHSFGHGGRCWQLTTVFSTRGLAKTSIAYRCNQECPTEQIDVSHWRSPIDVFRFSRATSLGGLSAICEAGSGPAVRRAAATCRTDAGAKILVSRGGLAGWIYPRLSGKGTHARSPNAGSVWRGGLGTLSNVTRPYMALASHSGKCEHPCSDQCCGQEFERSHRISPVDLTSQRCWLPNGDAAGNNRTNAISVHAASMPRELGT